MMGTQFCLDFAEPAILPRVAQSAATEARAFWSAGMVASLPLFSEVQGCQQAYTMMLPGVVESIAGDLASVRIYAAPEYGCWVENYPLHLKLAVNVPLRELGRFHQNHDLQRLVGEGRLAAGDDELAAEVRAQANFGHEREIAGRAA